MPLVSVGVLLATGRLHGRRKKAAVPAGRRRRTSRRRRTTGRSGSCASPGPGWPCSSARCAARRAPCTLSALHDLVKGEASTASQAVAVVLFVLIEFSLVIIPFAFLEFRPEGTKAQLQRFQDWLTGHARQLMAGVAIFAGTYMAISGLVRLL